MGHLAPNLDDILKEIKSFMPLAISRTSTVEAIGRIDFDIKSSSIDVVCISF